MKQVLHINNDLTVLTSTQMNLIRGGDKIDVTPFSSSALEDGLPTLPTLPATSIPDYLAANNGNHKGHDKHSK